MKKGMKLALPIMPTVLALMAAVFIIAACGPAVEPDPTFTVTFSGDGINVPSQTVKKDGKATDPGNPTYSPIQGLYKNYTAPSFSNWKDEDGATYDFSKPVTAAITLTGNWSSQLPTAETLTGASDIVTEAISKVNGDNTANVKYTLFLRSDVTPTVAAEGVTLTKGDLTIIGATTGQRTINAFAPTLSTPPPANSDVIYLQIGPATAPASGTTGPTLTLKNVILKGTGEEVGDSLVRVRHGGTLIMEDQSKITGHKNSAISSDGANGNGSAVCVYGGNLTMKAGSLIEYNESTKAAGGNTDDSATKGNRNRVGGVYTYVPTNGKVELKIEGGEIVDNKCTQGNTADLYATEGAGATFTLTGKTKIGELTINADPADANSVPATIIVFDLENNVGKLSLRSTGAISAVQTAWTGKQVLIGKNGGTTAPEAVDLAKFSLGDFKGNAGFQAISGYSLGSDGKLKKDS
jgi:hypothetical protein